MRHAIGSLSPTGIGLLFGLTVIGIMLATTQGIGSVLVDPDDAMRMVQVRDWLSGQAWGDLVQHRMQPGGTPMHWSRVVDLPVAAVILAARGLIEEDAAERLAMFVWPTILVPLLFVIVARTAATSARAAVACLALCTGALLWRFEPGRVDHHALMTTLAVGAAAPLLSRSDLRAGVGSGLAVALCLAVGYEDLAVFAALGVAMGILAFTREDTPLPTGFGLGLAGGSLASGLAFVPDFEVKKTVCDALSGGWLPTFFISGLGLAATARAKSEHKPIAVIVTALALAYPLFLVESGCRGGPFAGLSPLVRDYWLSRVNEMLDVLTSSQGQWRALVQPLLVPIVTAVGFYLAWESGWRPTRREAAYCGVFAVALLFGVRFVRNQGLPIALAAPLLARAFPTDLSPTRWKGWPALLAAILLLPPTLALEKTIYPSDETLEVRDARTKCMSKASYASMQTLKPGRVLTFIDMAPLVLWWTDLDVTAGGYHRAATGLDDQIRFWTGDPDEALAAARREGLSYVAWCDGLPESKLAAKEHPGGMADLLRRGELPDWLTPISGAGPIKVARVAAPPGGAVPAR